jgi:hypothetical protein
MMDNNNHKSLSSITGLDFSLRSVLQSNEPFEIIQQKQDEAISRQSKIRGLPIVCIIQPVEDP